MSIDRISMVSSSSNADTSTNTNTDTDTNVSSTDNYYCHTCE